MVTQGYFIHLGGCGIDIGPIGKEHLNQLVMPGRGGNDQWRPTVVVRCVHCASPHLKKVKNTLHEEKKMQLLICQQHHLVKKLSCQLNMAPEHIQVSRM